MDVTINGVRVHWYEAGSGEPVLWVHGFPFHGGMWAEQLERLPAGWHGIAPDLRGFGGSEAAGPGPYVMERFADDLAALLDARGVARAVVCGLSMGGYIAFALWRRHADRVRALVLCDTRAAADSEEARRGRRQLAERVRREGAAVAAEAMLPKLLAPRTLEQRPDVVERVRGMIESTPAETIARTLAGMAERPDSTPLLGTIGVPALVVVGSEDAITAPAEAATMAAALPEGRLEVIDGAGHLPNLEAPAAFDRVLSEFLMTLQGR